MKFSELKKEMTLKFEYGQSEISYIYISDINIDATTIEIKSFKKRDAIVCRELDVSEKAWNDWDMTYRRYSQANYKREMIESILSKQFYISIG